MDIQTLEKRLQKLSNRGILNRDVASHIVCIYCDNPDKQAVIGRDLMKIENLNDESEDFFIQLNILINEMLY